MGTPNRSTSGLISVRGRNRAPTYFAGNVPRFSYLFMKELSIFIDESGNFGTYDQHSPYYIFSLVYHDQKCDISESIQLLDHELDLINYGSHYFHAGPIIRRENEYKDLDIKTRRRIFNKMSIFVKNIEFKYSVVKINKKHISDDFSLVKELSKQLGKIIRNNLDFFQSFDFVKVYYDNGQKQLSKLLVTVFGSWIDNIEFKIVVPRDYNLFQVADYISSLELINSKYLDKTISQSEKCFFGERRPFARNYYKQIVKKRIA